MGNQTKRFFYFRTAFCRMFGLAVSGRGESLWEVRTGRRRGLPKGWQEPPVASLALQGGEWERWAAMSGYFPIRVIVSFSAMAFFWIHTKEWQRRFARLLFRNHLSGSG